MNKRQSPNDRGPHRHNAHLSKQRIDQSSSHTTSQRSNWPHQTRNPPHNVKSKLNSTLSRTPNKTTTHNTVSLNVSSNSEHNHKTIRQAFGSKSYSSSTIFNQMPLNCQIKIIAKHN